MKKLLEEAEKKGVAVGAFSVGNMEMVMGAVKAAEDIIENGCQKAMNDYN